MFAGARANAQSVLLVAAAVTLVLTCWLALRTGRRGRASLISHVAFPLFLAGLTLCFLPELMRACGVLSARYSTTLEGLLLRALWLGLMLDQSSWVQRTTHGLRGRRGTLPVLVWGLGFTVLLLATVAAQSQDITVTFLQRVLAELGMRQVDGSVLSGLLTDWAPGVARGGIAMTLVGACALAMQALLWLVRLAHVHAFTQAVDPDDETLPPYAPGRFQARFGFVFGVAGTTWLVWATSALLQQA